MNGTKAIELLGCSRAWLHELCKRGRIRITRLHGRRYDYSREDIERIISQKLMNKKEKRDPSLPLRVVQALGFDVDELRSRNASRALSDRRRIVATLLTDEGMTQTDIGRFMERRASAISAMLSTSYLVESEIAAARTLWQQHR